MTKKEKDQQEAMWELLSTEAVYISKLYIIKKVSKTEFYLKTNLAVINRPFYSCVLKPLI